MSTARVRTLLVSFAVGLATTCLMLATEPQMAIGWDEGYTLGRQARLRDWFRGLVDPSRFAAAWEPLPLDRDLVQRDQSPPERNRLGSRWNLITNRNVVEWFWPFAREEPHGHPPFYALIGLAGDVVAPSWQVLPRARLGPILLFSLTAGVIHGFVSSRWGTWAAALAAGAWVLQPNLFGHGHYAAYDAVLTSLWILAIIVFAHTIIPKEDPGGERQSARWGWRLVFGVILGCAAATKFTGWFLPLPFLIWSGVCRSRTGFKTILFGGLIAIAVVLALMPPWWTDPVNGVVRFLNSNLNRGKTMPIWVQFLGVGYYTPNDSLPWYNTLVWTLFVTPVGFLIFAGTGFWAALRFWRSEPIGPLLVGHWAFLMLLRALPHTPGHDGVRLFLPAFGVLALLAGLGARYLIVVWGRWAKAAIALALIEGVVTLAVMMPVPLSYFSPLVGGLPGASTLGMEPTYYWDALDRDSRRWLAAHTLPGETIQFATFPHSWLYLRSIGELPRRLVETDRGQPTWYVLQNRPGAFLDADRALAAQGRPAYTVTKLGVPLVWIFPYSEFLRLNARARIQAQTIPIGR
jgi:4-amino-4-deoxy-L-arabinose transferase-like glycosyltransferase